MTHKKPDERHAVSEDADPARPRSISDGTVTDGPFPETKAVIGGFSILEVPDGDEALRWAARIAEGCRCAQEVRELMYDPES